MRRSGLAALAAVAILAVGFAGCGDDDEGPPADVGDAGCRRPVDGRVTLVAEDLAWDVDCLEVPADQPVTIEVDNRDRRVNHNLRVVGAPDEPATELEPGPLVQELDVQVPVGAYRYVCDIHPTMVGELQATGQPGASTSTPRSTSASVG